MCPLSELAGTVEGVNDGYRLLREIHAKANVSHAAGYSAVHTRHFTKRPINATVTTRWFSRRRPRRAVDATGPRLQTHNVFLGG